MAAGLLLCLALGAVTRVQLHPWVLALFLALKGCRLCSAPGKAGHGVPQPARALEQCVPQPGPGLERGVRDDATCYFGGSGVRFSHVGSAASCGLGVRAQ